MRTEDNINTMYPEVVYASVSDGSLVGTLMHENTTAHELVIQMLEDNPSTLKMALNSTHLNKEEWGFNELDVHRGEDGPRVTWTPLQPWTKMDDWLRDHEHQISTSKTRKNLWLVLPKNLITVQMSNTHNYPSILNFDWYILPRQTTRDVLNLLSDFLDWSADYQITASSTSSEVRLSIFYRGHLETLKIISQYTDIWSEVQLLDTKVGVSIILSITPAWSWLGAMTDLTSSFLNILPSNFINSSIQHKVNENLAETKDPEILPLPAQRNVMKESGCHRGEFAQPSECTPQSVPGNEVAMRRPSFVKVFKGLMECQDCEDDVRDLAWLIDTCLHKNKKVQPDVWVITVALSQSLQNNMGNGSLDVAQFTLDLMESLSQIYNNAKAAARKTQATTSPDVAHPRNNRGEKVSTDISEMQLLSDTYARLKKSQQHDAKLTNRNSNEINSPENSDKKTGKGISSSINMEALRFKDEEVKTLKKDIVDLQSLLRNASRKSLVPRRPVVSRERIPSSWRHNLEKLSDVELYSSHILEQKMMTPVGAFPVDENNFSHRTPATMEKTISSFRSGALVSNLADGEFELGRCLSDNLDSKNATLQNHSDSAPLQPSLKKGTTFGSACNEDSIIFQSKQKYGSLHRLRLNELPPPLPPLPPPLPPMTKRPISSRENSLKVFSTRSKC